MHDLWWLVGGWPTLLKNDGVCQLGWWTSQLNGKKYSCSKPPTILIYQDLSQDIWYLYIYIYIIRQDISGYHMFSIPPTRFYGDLMPLCFSLEHLQENRDNISDGEHNTISLQIFPPFQWSWGYEGANKTNNNEYLLDSDVFSCVQMYGRKFGMHDVCCFWHTHGIYIRFPVLSNAMAMALYSIPSNMDMDWCVMMRLCQMWNLYIGFYLHTTIPPLFGHFYTPPYWHVQYTVNHSGWSFDYSKMWRISILQRIYAFQTDHHVDNGYGLKTTPHIWVFTHLSTCHPSIGMYISADEVNPTRSQLCFTETVSKACGLVRILSIHVSEKNTHDMDLCIDYPKCQWFVMMFDIW